MKAEKVLFSGAYVETAIANAGLLLLRASAGLTLALNHGISKLPPSAGFIDSVGGMGFPIPVFFAWAAALSEFLGGLFLAFGFITRPAAGAVLVVMLVAFFIVHGADPFDKKEMALLYGMIATQFLMAGAGRYSIDALFRRR